MICNPPSSAEGAPLFPHPGSNQSQLSYVVGIYKNGILVRFT